VKDRMARGPMTPDTAATLALKGLAFLVDSGPAMDRFIDLTGFAPASLRTRADEPEFLVSVLDFLLSNEEVLVRFCDDAEVDVRAVHMARHVLAGSG
jgi:hypothetical protein